MNEYLTKMKEWIDNPQTDPELKKELSQLQTTYAGNENDKALGEEIKDRFYKDMEFGTGGLRGKVGAGTNRMNVHTVRRVSQAFADHLKQISDKPSAVIAYDNRKYSDVFAFESACVFAANGIKVWLFEELTPTPMLSYAVRQLKTTGGVVVTASHNPKEYNGYKIYDKNGCQCLPSEANKIADEMDKLDLFNGVMTCADSYSGNLKTRIEKGILDNENISFVPETVNKSYYDEAMKEKAFSGSLSEVNVVYTPLNGTGNVPVTTVLKKAGAGKLNIVKVQQNPDPEFSTCPRPNPEEDDALIEGLKLCHELEKKGDAPDILIATDPDCDRIGIMVKEADDYLRLDGNQVGVLLFDYIVENLKAKNNLPEKPVMITTIVSTPMTDGISSKNQIHVDRVLTGFKFIGGRIDSYDSKGEASRFVFGFEESCGYLSGTYVRDKDAVTASLLVADMVGFYKSKQKTLITRMNELYEEYGYYLTEQKNIEKAGPSGAEEIQSMMTKLRDPVILTDFTQDVIEFLDYNAQTKRTMGLYEGDEGGCAVAIGTRPISGLPKENVLEFNFKNRSKVIIRPSGTEPKIKIYFTAVAETQVDAHKNMKEIQDDFCRLIEKM